MAKLCAKDPIIKNKTKKVLIILISGFLFILFLDKINTLSLTIFLVWTLIKNNIIAQRKNAGRNIPHALAICLYSMITIASESKANRDK